MRTHERRLVCSKRVYDLVTVECIAEFKAAHPQLVEMKITQDEILNQIAKFYLNEDPRRER